MIRIVLIAVAIILAMQFSAKAEKMDIATHSVLISKLQRVLETLPDSNPAKTDLVLRLADLFAERSRLETMDEVAKNCSNCPESKNDRTSAIQLYKKGVAKADKDSKARAILQMAQLYQLQSQPDQAMEVYKDVINHKDEYSAELVGQSYAGLGELYFNKIKYSEAQTLFENAVKIPETPKKAHINYRLAWCLFHKDNITKGTALLVQVLQSDEVSQDNSFKEEASRDLATFISRGTIDQSQIQQLSNLSPVNVKKDNLVYLAKELDRLGKKSASVVVWNFVGQGEKSPRDQMESHLRLAELQFDAGKKDQTLLELTATVDLWKNDGCDNKDECSVLRNRIRKLVIDWNRSEQDAPTALLGSAYNVYVTVFPDMEMNYRAALVARHLNQLDKALILYKNAADLAYSELKQGALNKQDQEIFQKDFEASLLGQIEIAEMTKDSKSRSEAYSHYLTMNPQGRKGFEVRYQQAHLLYDNGKTLEASKAFRDLALTSNGEMNLREKSADLSLDALVLAKSEESIIVWAKEYASAFPARRSDFLKIASKGTLNEVVITINDPSASNAQMRTALDKLNKLNLSASTHTEKISFARNKLILAEKLKDLPEVKKSAQSLLALKGISTEDKEFALSRLAWAAEMTLDFKTAFSLTSRLKMSGISEDEKLLRLAMLADLSGKDSTKYYQQYLMVSKSSTEAGLIAAKLVRRSNKPRQTLNKYEKILRSQPELLASLALEIFAKDHDYNFARKMLNEKAIQSTMAAHVFSRFLFIRDFSSLETTIAKQRLETRTDASLKRSLKRRLDLLQKIEKSTAYALKTEDWVLQIVTLDSLSKQNRRLATEVITLSAPRGLNRKQSLQYKEMLAQDAAKYQGKGRELSTKVTELWNKDAMASALIEDYSKSKGEVRRLLAEELKLIARVAPRGQRITLVQALATGEFKPAPINLKAAEESVKENPFNVGNIEKFKTLEERAGGETMVAYLDARILKMQSSGVKR